MSESEKRRYRRRKKAVRNFKKTVTGIMLAPGKMPRLTVELTNRIMRLCELAAVVFVAVLMLNLANPSSLLKAMVVVVGVVFVSLLALIGLSDYQDKLAEYELFGFRV